jgi:diguanylate cyclase (GGDEF)-like protein/PAS domain S-box-containing protein
MSTPTSQSPSQALATPPQSEVRFHQLLSTVPQQIWTALPDGSLDYVNQQVIDYFGRSFEVMIGTGWVDLVHPDDLHKTILNWTRSLTTGKNYENNFRLRRYDGVYRWHIARAAALFDTQGNITQWVGTSADITQFKDAEMALQESEARLAAAQVHAKIGSWRRNLTSHETEWSAEMYRLFNQDPARKPPGFIDFVHLVHPDDRKPFMQYYNRYIRESGNHQIDFRVVQPNGECCWIEARSETLRDNSGRALLLSGTAQDITERKLADATLQKTTRLLDASQAIAKVGGWELDLITGSLFWTHETYRIHDTTPEEFNPTVDAGVGYFLPESREKISTALAAAINDGESYDLELQTLTTKGRLIDVRTTGFATRKNNRTIKLSGIFQDICEQKAIQREMEAVNKKLERTNRALEHIAHFDTLTNLPNRVLLADRLQQAMAHTQRREQIMAVAFLDLDGFKAVNDKYGHAVGDKLLVYLAQKMKSSLRESDTLARIGGDEFVVVLTDLQHTTDCEPLLTRLLQAAAAPIELDNLLLEVSASIGVTLYPQDGSDADQLLRHADQAMYLAKQSGKNCYRIFDIAKDVAVKHQRETLEHIRSALYNHEFVLYYQPKVHMRTGQVIGAEALIRWQHPQYGLMPPAAFLPVIENHLLSIELGEWVIETALNQMIEWEVMGLEIPVSVNIGAIQLQQINFAERLEALLHRHPAANPHNLELEILETSALEDITQVSTVINACKRLGVSFALDDFGTGYSSLAYLKKLPAQILKIDQSFVRDMLEDTDDLAIIKGIVGLANAFHRTVIAEGVETIAHGEILLAMGCELAQGYGIARPMPAAAIPEWANTWRPDTLWLNAG